MTNKRKPPLQKKKKKKTQLINASAKFPCKVNCLVIGYDYVSPQAPVTTSALALAHKASVYTGHHGDKVG